MDEDPSLFLVMVGWNGGKITSSPEIYLPLIGALRTLVYMLTLMLTLAGKGKLAL